jgi:hypothetical protein
MHLTTTFGHYTDYAMLALIISTKCNKTCYICICVINGPCLETLKANHKAKVSCVNQHLQRTRAEEIKPPFFCFAMKIGFSSMDS